MNVTRRSQRVTQKFRGTDCLHAEGSHDPTCPAVCSYLSTCYVRGLSFLSIAPAHAPVGGSTLVWEPDALSTEKETGHGVGEKGNISIPSGTSWQGQDLNEAVKKMLIRDLETKCTNSVLGLQLPQRVVLSLHTPPMSLNLISRSQSYLGTPLSHTATGPWEWEPLLPKAFCN